MDTNFSPAAISSVVLLAAALSTSTAFLEPYDLLYDNAVQAFYNSDYHNVVRYMEGALSSYAEVRRTRVRCRLTCQDQHPFDETFMDLRFSDAVLQRAACMNRCIEEKLGSQSVHKVSEDVLQDFHRRIPYNYLQLAYQKVRRGGRGLHCESASALPQLICGCPHLLVMLQGKVMQSDDRTLGTTEDSREMCSLHTKLPNSCATYTLKCDIRCCCQGSTILDR